MTTWQKPAACHSGECIEVRRVGDRIHMRETAHVLGMPDPTLMPRLAEFAAFIAAAKAGEYDHLTQGEHT